MSNENCDLSIIVITEGEIENCADRLSQVRSTLNSLHISYEILVIANRLDEGACRSIEQGQARLVLPSTPSYGSRLQAAIRQSTGHYIITIDADQHQISDFLRSAWSARESAEVIIGSRYMQGGQAHMPTIRKGLSKLLNAVFSRGLDLRVQDMSSAFRLYKSHVIKGLITESQDYDILQEILVKIKMTGYRIKELPFTYRSNDPAYFRTVKFGQAYLKTFARLWKLRNSIASADYDARAYDALMPPQRYWQRQRYKIITTLILNQGKGIFLDVGCGSSRIIGALPPGSLALDILMRKLRYARQFGRPVVQGSIFSLPIPTESFPGVLCSQVIEHLPRANALEEIDRVLQPGGFLILGTPDYANWQWRVIEWLYKVLLPQAYADEHITHYTYQELVGEFVSKRGYKLETVNYVLKGELILGLRKPVHATRAN